MYIYGKNPFYTIQSKQATKNTLFVCCHSKDLNQLDKVSFSIRKYCVLVEGLADILNAVLTGIARLEDVKHILISMEFLNLEPAWIFQYPSSFLLNSPWNLNYLLSFTHYMFLLTSFSLSLSSSAAALSSTLAITAFMSGSACKQSFKCTRLL